VIFQKTVILSELIINPTFMKTYTIEVCSASYQSAAAAQAAGAGRIELCSSLGTGGVTPSAGLLEMVTTHLNIRTNVLIRPREGDFLYSSYEAEETLRDIGYCGRLGVHGVVVGALDSRARIDSDMCREFARAARRAGLSTTFHRAIDRTSDIFSALEEVMSLGYDRVLTSGGCPTAYEGMETIARMEEMTHTHLGGRHTVIMPGSGVKPENIREIALRTGVCELHMSASHTYKSGMEVLGGIASADPQTVTHSDSAIISGAIAALMNG